MATVTLTLDEYEALRALIGSERESEGAVEAVVVKPKRKPSAYNKAYSKAFGKVKNKYMKKSGGWKKNGFKNAANAARKMIK